MTHRSIFRRLGVLALTAGCLLAAGQAAAQSGYPDRPVRVVLPYPAGGNTDVIARAVMKEVSARISQM